MLIYLILFFLENMHQSYFKLYRYSRSPTEEHLLSQSSIKNSLFHLEKNTVEEKLGEINAIRSSNLFHCNQQYLTEELEKFLKNTNKQLRFLLYVSIKTCMVLYQYDTSVSDVQIPYYNHRIDIGKICPRK